MDKIGGKMSKLFRINLPDVIKVFCISAAAGLFISISNALSSGMLPDMIHSSLMTHFVCSGSNTISGSLSSLPSVMTYFDCEGSNTISGSLSSLPSLMTHFVCLGSNTISGSLSSLPSVMTIFDCEGSNTINSYSPPKTFNAALSYLILIPGSGGGLSSALIDSLYIDLDCPHLMKIDF
jgi:hypothetical protein